MGVSGRATRPGNLDQSLSPGALVDDLELVVLDGRHVKWEEQATSRCPLALALGLSVSASERLAPAVVLEIGLPPQRPWGRSCHRLPLGPGPRTGGWS